MKTLDGQLWAYVPGALVSPHNRPVLRGEWVHRRWSRWTMPDVVGVVRRQGFGRVDLLYIDSVNQAFWLDAIDARRSILRIADNQTGFAKFTPAMRQLEREVAARVDLVAYTAYRLRSYAETLGPRALLHLSNGVDFHHFAEGSRISPPEYAGLPRPIAVYVGAMEEWFDFALVAHAAQRLPDVSFVLIGPDHLARRRLAAAPNIHLLGRRPFAKLPRYLHNADVGLIPFDVHGHSELVHSVNPLKLYEYMACGLPVVATSWGELQELRSPAVLCASEQEFVSAVSAAATNGAEHRRESVRFAAAADWQHQVSRLLAALDLGSCG
ncbi:MAG TPA: glycosyltransferase [Gemmatimonadaceae bacterium]|nr:glycosyltransferase [Gemmatimonadaceae bacterium]